MSNTLARFNQHGGPDVIGVETDAVLPIPGPGEVRIRVEASSVQFTDTLIRRGIYPDLRGKPPFTTGYDLVGRVDAVGAGVEGWAAGDRVADLSVVGGNAQYALRPAAGLTPVPDTVDAAEATTLVLSWMTAWQCLHRVGDVQAGSRVLVIGGNGAVGQALIQLSRLAGAEVFATASAQHHDLLRAMGAAPLPRDGWLDDTVRSSMDIVVDGVCADQLRSPYAAVRPGGIFIPIGMSAVVNSGASSAVAIWAYLKGAVLLGLWPDGRRARFYNIARVRKKHPGWWTEDLSALMALLADAKIEVSVAERLGFADVAEAHRRLEEGGLRGKLVLIPA